MSVDNMLKIIKDAMAGDVNSLRKARELLPKIDQMILEADKKSASEVDYNIAAVSAVFTLSDYLSETLSDESYVMSFENRVVIPIKISGYIDLTKGQFKDVVDSTSLEHKKNYSNPVKLTVTSVYYEAESPKRYIEYLVDNYKSISDMLGDVMPKNILMPLGIDVIDRVEHDRRPCLREYEFKNVALFKVPDVITPVDIVDMSMKALNLLKFIKRSEEISIYSMSFVDSDGKPVIIREKSGENQLSRVRLFNV